MWPRRRRAGIAALLCAAFGVPSPGAAAARSQKVLVISGSGENAPGDVASGLGAQAAGMRLDVATVDEAGSLSVGVSDGAPVEQARPQPLAALLTGYDTVVLWLLCDVGTALDAAAKTALVGWVAAGHKLVIHDADECRDPPDYSFLPFPFKMDYGGQVGLPSSEAFFVEDDTLGSSDPLDPTHHVDVAAWLESNNELGDAGVVRSKAPQWCGHLFTVNRKGVSGFSQAYARHGKGLIIYDGVDNDELGGEAHDRLLRLELEQPFDPDGLPCKVKVASEFLIAIAPAAQAQLLAAGSAFEFPVAVYSNQGYTGKVGLSVVVEPTEAGLRTEVVPATVALGDRETAVLRVTTSPKVPLQTYRLRVTGADAAGKRNETLATLWVPSADQKPARLRLVPPEGEEPGAEAGAREVELILDASGSMWQKIGKLPKIGIARQVLRDLLAKLPDDARVGLRAYGHRHKKGPEACRDTELLVPIAKLDRERIGDHVGKLVPTGETPLVHSVLQAPADFGPAKTGAIVLVTDGAESCKGDVKGLPARLKAAAPGIKLSIVGFDIDDKALREELKTLARATGGDFFAASDRGGLAAALFQAAAHKRAFAVTGDKDREVARGVVGEVLTVPPGVYRVTLLGEQPASLDGVVMKPGGSVELKVVKAEEGFAIEP